MEIVVAGNEVSLRFSLEHLAGADTFRWSLATEWGSYEVLGTQGMARDRAPDGGAPARFPG